MKNEYPVSEELTLRDLFLIIQDYVSYFLRKWYWVVLSALLIGGVLFYSAYTEDTTYSAPLTFVLNSDQKGPTGAGAILGNLGFGGGGGVSPALELIEMARSRQLVGRVLFDSTEIGGKKQLIANHLIGIYDYHDGWKDNEQLSGFLFSAGKPAKDDRVGNSVFKQLHGLLTRKEEGIVNITVDDLTGVLTINTRSLHPDLSIAMTEKLYEELKQYYVASTVSGKQQTLDQLRLRADSIQKELAVAEVNLARFQDRKGRVLNLSSTRGQQLSREVLILGTMYSEVVKNRETTAFLLANERPAFSLIDEPLAPLSAKGGDWKMGIALGLFLGAFLSLLILFFTKLVKDTMAI